MVQETVHVAESTGLLSTLGINYKLFLAQLVNFSLVLFVIWKWVYTPLITILDERTAKIEKGLKDAEESALLKSTSKEEKDALIIEARTSAREIIEKAEADASRITEEKITKTKVDVERIVVQGKEQLKSERERMIEEVKEEMTELLVLAVERIAYERLDAKKDKEIIENALAKNMK